ncbi:hypothetical protein [Streptomyces sp. NPDC085932]|uniref:hypothetical protein n=1 Tax=Streptomyces sp. NPDC085932 TaxID=3365741 RepID=UPI0037CD7BD0
MTDTALLYSAVLERWDAVPDSDYANWWEFSQALCQSDLSDYAYYFTEFTNERPDLHERPESVTPEDYRQFVVAQLVEWFTYRVAQDAAYTAAAGQDAAYAQDTGHGQYAQVEEEYGYEDEDPDTYPPEEPIVQEEPPVPADPAVLQELTEALAAFTSEAETGIAVTEEQVDLMQAHGLEIEVDIDELPPLSDEDAA